MRQLFSKLHLWLSVPVGLVLSVICLSGALLVFESELTRRHNAERYRVAVPAGAPAVLPPSELAARIRAQVADTLVLASLQYASRPDEAAQATFENARRRTLCVDPYTGRAQGWVEPLTFMQTTRKLHRWLLDAPARKGDNTVGKVVVGVSTLLMVVILLTGVVLWWPRTRRVLRRRLSLSVGRGAFRFLYDSHVSLGIYATAFLLVMALTGLTWSFGWYRTAAYGLFGATTERSAGPKGPAEGRTGRPDAHKGEGRGAKERRGAHAPEAARTTDYAAWDVAMQEALSRYPHYRTLTIESGTVAVVPPDAASARAADRLTFDTATGSVERVTPYADQPAQQRLKGQFYAWHTGSWGGMTTKVLYFLAALIGGLLPLTGYYLWLRRLWRRRRR